MMNGLWFDLTLLLALLPCLGLVFALQRQELNLDEEARLLAAKRRPGLLRRWLFPARLMRQAGIMPARLRLLYWPGKLALAVLLPLALLEWQGPWSQWPALCAASILGLFAFDLWLLRRRQRRRARIQRTLGFFVDLLRAYLSSGAALAQAFEQAARFGFKADHPLAREALLVCAELNAGQSLRKALQGMGQRTGVQELRRLAAVFEVGTQVGAPILQTLEKQSQILLEKQRAQAAQVLNRKSMEMLFPLGLVCLPMFLLLVIFPAGVQLYDAVQILKHLL
ncbi:type II secretion system F family protein [Pseudomonas sp. TCU-HL1]|uniref:type II secretion system F family protein n=1 Tax=Pseudomonas sp. TCU-HL1 TaxID=1856685 RepID=UPI00083D5FDD|nr:type II secretion system F family protein [Pseudomonas sp. TCU-HL1]AOE83780.1 type II secretion system protein [Pseudomonas sp. TCU-HL1]